MGLVEQAKKDWQQITSASGGFGVDITFTSPTAQTVTIKGLFAKHHLGIDDSGQAVNTRTAHISFSEKLLTDAVYNLRNADNRVDLKRHIVEVKDSTGLIGKYVIREWMPDETIGVILCNLGDFKD